MSEPVRHATANSIAVLSGVRADNMRLDHTACLWEPTTTWSFNAADADELLVGGDCVLPTCPQCAVLVDMALESRGE